MFRFLHTADIHLDSPLKGLEVHDDAPVDEIRGATRRAFENLVEMAIEEKIDFILIAGDLYDGDWKDYNTGLFFVRQMGRLHKAGIKVFIVSGNHDAASQTTKTMPLPDNVTLFSPRKPQSVKLDDIGVMIHGRSYSSRAVTENLASSYRQHDSNFFNIGLLHTSLTGREGHEDYAPCTIDDLKSKGYDYWALGHVHQREVVAEDPWVLFPGNLQGRHIKETGAKGATLVTVEDGRITEVEARELDVLRWTVCLAELSECETKEAIYERVRTAMEKEIAIVDGQTLALRLQLAGSCPLHAELHARSVQWTEEFRGIAAGLGDVWLEKVKFRTNRKTSLAQIVGEDTALSGLLQAVESLEFDGDALTTWVPDLANLKTKLPAELLDVDSLLAVQPEHLSELRDAVKELLIAKLIQHGGEA
ncbi:DNA repair exonuclease family protein YhaO [Olavius sp. associated proteobacterium Delta 1]|nr:DNA repair exonuclease family protein YhaO [Olavius sp. associated proteobacterium Delta 1]